jgi:hypothetical protein
MTKTHTNNRQTRQCAAAALFGELTPMDQELTLRWMWRFAPFAALKARRLAVARPYQPPPITGRRRKTRRAA